jgi:hypothetical protein
MQRFRCSIFQIIFVFYLSAILLTGCATLPLPTPSDRIGETGSLGSCAEFFASLDQSVEKAKVIDPGAFRVKKYPYLRVDRFVASFHAEVDNKAAFAAWTDRMQALDQDARQYEIANLPNPAVAALTSVNDRAGLNRKIVTCGGLLKAADLRNAKHQEALSKNVSVPDEYITLRRVLGIYPFTSMFVYSGVSNWHAEARKTYSPKPPVDWRTIRYVPAPKKTDLSSAYQIAASAKRDALGIPIYAAEERETLFRMYAPVWEIQYQGDDDRIGAPYWTDKGVLRVNTDQPVTYTLLSFARFGKEILTQINYIIWFPSRPKEGALDIYGGFLDGVNYRVTLDNTGEPLTYETMHNCGCYYKAYPTSRLQVRDKIDYAEPPLILEAPDVNPSMDVMTVAMESRTHFVQHLYPLTRDLQPATTVYSLADYGQLRSLPHLEGDRRSMFGQDSIAHGSKRLERFILWPMGVHSPGAMRQWGRHAAAFVGRRHFDDPFFMDRMFVKTDSSWHDGFDGH